MSEWTPESFARAASGSWLVEPARQIRGASIDTRELEPGQAFFALRGENVDGHAFAARAGELGASAVVVEDVEAIGAMPEGVGVLRVADARAALRDLAAACRASRPGLAVVGVTGSNGKTTTTRLIHAALSGEKRGTCSRRSFNNDLGVPLTLLNAGGDDDYVVCEIGASGPGEIARLAAIARPRVGVITSIGRAHIEGFGSLAGVVREKGSLILSLPAGALGVAPDDAPALDDLLASAGADVIRVGASDSAGARVSGITPDAGGVAFELEGFGPLRIPLLGAHNARNAAMAALVARRLGVSDEAIRAGLARAEGAEMRLAVEHVRFAGGAITLVNDAYNANPDSIRAALATLASMTPGAGGRRVAVLGDMLELGPGSDQEHRSLLASVPGSVGLVHAVGAAMNAAAAGGSDARIRGAATLDEQATSAILDTLRPGDVVLLKGSRGMRLERLAEALRGGAGVHSPSPTDGG